MLLCQILVSTIYGKLQKRLYKTIGLKYQLQNGMIKLNHLSDHYLYLNLYQTNIDLADCHLTLHLVCSGIFGINKYLRAIF